MEVFQNISKFWMNLDIYISHFGTLAFFFFCIKLGIVLQQHFSREKRRNQSFPCPLKIRKGSI